jgi:hypothetical protein
VEVSVEASAWVSAGASGWGSALSEAGASGTLPAGRNAQAVKQNSASSTESHLDFSFIDFLPAVILCMDIICYIIASNQKQRNGEYYFFFVFVVLYYIFRLLYNLI